VFEFTSAALGAQSGVGGGGRYDGLVQDLGGPPTPGMGWAAGVERILLAGAATAAALSPVELFVALGEEPRRAGRDGEEDLKTGPPSGGPGAGAWSEAGASGRRRAAFELLCAARSAGVIAEMELAGRSLKGQLTHANALGARYVAIVDGGETVLRDMQDGGQERMATDAVVHAVLRRLRDL
jgi:histidyl-tRNA synthetase